MLLKILIHSWWWWLSSMKKCFTNWKKNISPLNNNNNNIWRKWPRSWYDYFVQFFIEKCFSSSSFSIESKPIWWWYTTPNNAKRLIGFSFYFRFNFSMMIIIQDNDLNLNMNSYLDLDSSIHFFSIERHFIEKGKKLIFLFFFPRICFHYGFHWLSKVDFFWWFSVDENEDFFQR